jgi:hypothetical protein
MIPVITSTKTDKSAIALAGVEAGAKIFVPLGDEPFGSLAHTAIADQNRRSIVCTWDRIVEDFIFNIDISVLPSPNSEMLDTTSLRNLSLFLLQGVRRNSYRPEFD